MGGGKEQKKTNQMLDNQQTQIASEHREDRGEITENREKASEELGASRSQFKEGLAEYKGRDYSIDPNQFKISGPERVSANSIDPHAFDVDASGFRVDPNQFKMGGAGSYDLDQKGFDVDANKHRTNTNVNLNAGNYRVDPNAHTIDSSNYKVDSGAFDSKYNPNFTRDYFEEFANTGGYSPGDKANIRSRATSVIPSIYDNLNREVDRAGLVNGRMGPGSMALKAKLARQSAGDASRAALDAEVGIKDRVNEGRMFGATGIAGIEGQRAGIEANQSNLNMGRRASLEEGNVNRRAGLDEGNVNRRAGLEEGNVNRAATIDTGNVTRSYTQDADNASRGATIDVGNMERQANIGTGNMQRRFGADQTNNQIGAQIESANMGRSASIAEGNAGRGSSIAGANTDRMFAADRYNSQAGDETARYNSGMGLGVAEGNVGRQIDQDRMGLSGDQYLMDSAQDDYNNEANRGISERGLTYDAQGNLVDNRMQNNPKRDWFGTIMGAGTGIARGAMGV